VSDPHQRCGTALCCSCPGSLRKPSSSTTAAPLTRRLRSTWVACGSTAYWGIPPAAAAAVAACDRIDALLVLLDRTPPSANMIDRIPPRGGNILAAAWTLCGRHHPREPADTSPYVHIQCLVMSQQPTPTGNPCLHASFQKENRTLAMWSVLRRSVPDYLTLARGAMPNLVTQPRRPNLVEPESHQTPPASSSSHNRSFRTTTSRG